MNERVAWNDLLWLLAYPLYQTIGTIRHEASHALFALIEGAAIEQFVAWPSMRNTKFYWGYVVWSGQTSWLTTAAPYLVAVCWYLLFFGICTRVRIRRHWVWINIVAIGLITPVVDTAYNYMNGLRKTSTNDVAKLIQCATVPDWALHAFFVGALTLYAVGLLHLLISGERTDD